MEPSEAYEVIQYIPAASLPYSQPGSCYSLVRLPDDEPTAGVFCFFVKHTHTHTHCCSSSLRTHLFSPPVSCTFSCTMKYLVRDCDPNTGEPDDDGYDDEYVVRSNDTSAGGQNDICVPPLI